MAEMRTFVFAVTFIIIFSAIITTIPIGLQGQGATATEVNTVNPNLLTDFADTKEFDKTDFSAYITWVHYVYDLPVGGATYDCSFITDYFGLGVHTLFIGLWLGGIEYINFISENGTNYGTTVSFDDIDNDADDGAVRYSLQYADSGNSAGGFVFYWNTTTYTGSSDAWDSSELFLLHGVGMTADTNIASLLIQLLFLQLPDMPILINLILIIPIWASIIYLLWFIIISMIPFLGV